MAAASQSWTVYEHGPLEKLESNLWRVEGALPGKPLRRVMTIARTSGGELVIHNGIALEDPLMLEIEAFGRPRYLIVPNGFHRMDAPAYKARYPQLEVVCPKAARSRVEKVVPVTLTYEAFPNNADVSLRHLEGAGEGEGVMTVRHGASATVVFNDMVFNMPHLQGLQGFVLKHLTGSTGGPKVSRIGKLFFVKNARALRHDFEALSRTPGLKRIIVSHHETIENDPAGVLRAIAQSV